MDNESISAAIRRAERGIRQYQEIMDLFPKVDVSVNKDFQKRFNYFYRVRQRTQEFYEVYYRFMENAKTTRPSFTVTLSHIHTRLGRHEPSFSSKLAATVDPSLPIWDSFILKHTGQKTPPQGTQDKMARMVSIYENIQRWYQDFLKTDEASLIISTFDRMIRDAERITDIKKVDFVLWQTRPECPPMSSLQKELF